MKEKLETFFRSLFNKEYPPRRIIYLLVIGMVALFLLIFGRSFSNPLRENDIEDYELTIESEEEQTTVEDPIDQSELDLEKRYEIDLEEMLEKAVNLSEVEVMVNLDSTDIKVYEQNIMKGKQTTNEEDTNGGKRKVEDQTEETEAVLIRQGDQETPLLVQTRKPRVRGVLIIAKGADDLEVQMWITEAVSKVLDVPTHKVSVIPRGGGGEK